MNNRPLSEEYIGKRLLISNYSVSCSDPTEASVLEVSPSGEYVKIEIKKVDNTTYTKWCHAHDYVVLEELGLAWSLIKDLRETERKSREEFHKHSTSPTAKPSYWDTYPSSICSSDYADAPDFHATNYEVQKQKWVHGICNPPSDDAKKHIKDCECTGKRYNSVAELLDDSKNW